MKNLLFIYNPRAGKGTIAAHLDYVVDTFVKNGYKVTVYPTQCPGDGEVIAREWSADYDRIVCAGGDGTLDEIVTGVMTAKTKIPIGYIPTGSTNDFARSMGIPRTVKRAADKAAKDSLFKCDLGMFNSRYFVYVAAFAEAVKRLPSIRSIPLRISYDDRTIRGDFLVGLITNSDSVGGMKRLTGPDVKLNDGIFEVMLVKSPDNIFELNLMGPAILDRRVRSDNVICFKCSQISFESDEPIPWNLDGEFGGNADHVNIKNMHEAVEFVV